MSTGKTEMEEKSEISDIKNTIYEIKNTLELTVN